jgi:hypothetical protein
MKSKVAFCVAAILGLSACGGGGGGNTPAAPAIPNLKNAPLPAILWDAAVMPTTDDTLTLTGGAYTVGFRTSQCISIPPGTGYFAGQLADCYNDIWSVELTADPTVGDFGITNTYFLMVPSYLPLGCSPCTGLPPQSITVATWTPPATLDVGAAGQLATLSATTPTDAMVETYSVAAYSPTAVLVTVTETGQQPSDNGSESYTVDAGGNVQLVSMTKVVNGQTIVFTP